MAKPSNLATLISNIRQVLVTPIIEDQNVIISGHVRNYRSHRDVIFVDLVDGSTNTPLQCIIAKEHKDKISIGSYLSCLGNLINSKGPKQAVEFKIRRVKYHGPCDPKKYPFSASKELYPFHYYRKWMHLRPRTPFFTSLARVKSELLLSAHMIMKQMDFFQVDTPILTSNDSESNSDLFLATRTKVDNSSQVLTSDNQIDEGSDDDLNETDTKVVDDTHTGRCIRQDYFKDDVFLTCSSQLHLEVMVASLSKVYTTSHTFRAENSVTKRHLCEFSMFEVEEAHLNDLDALMDRVESILKFMANYITNISDHKAEANDLIQRLDYTDKVNKLLTKPFIRMQYSEAINNLQQKKVDIEYGHDISRTHERTLLEYCDNVPLYITNYPKHLKPFYMKIDQATQEAKCFDLIAPTGGEICGGGLREDSYEALLNRVQQMDQGDLDLEKRLAWYLDLRKYGTFPHGGFGIGLDRFAQSLLGLENIKDVSTFPRWPGHCYL